jgi:hypothetical protein
LVGSVISCQGAPFDAGADLGIPHVQSHAVAMTQAALRLIRDEEGVFDGCRQAADGRGRDASRGNSGAAAAGSQSAASGDTGGADSGDAAVPRLHTEQSVSIAMLRAGLNLDCMMLRYQGVDWLDDSNWGCNAK